MADFQIGNPRPRPSLQLTRLVLHVIVRFKSRVKSRKQPDHLEAQAFEEISR